ncbi:PREDICTED: WAT1-related protein At1g09380-like [Ipomoea nil]|uniref:WAT1-related protein At1g09380-like n=1 Tax=Ipomoea nil TaxID=35883 RepID=UPI0009014012|nr:PREDICTED: WAT1-related protein At1g09380-like [Ipomoea nil]
MGCSDLLPLFVMVIVQLGYAGVNIVATAVMGAGMNPFIHIAYQQMFATIALAPLAYFLERKSRPKMTPKIFFQILLASFFGLTGEQISFFVGLNNSTPTVASALGNLIPAITFIAALVFSIGGAMLLTLYRGPVVIGQSTIHWKYAKNTVNKNSSSSHGNVILGPIMVILSCCAYTAFLITQARLSKHYGAPYSSTALACFLAVFECMIIALCVDHSVSDWTLTPIRAVSTTYNGLVNSALRICLISWCIERKGPLYVAVFTPLLFVLTAILSWAFLREKIYTGTVVGSILIVVGLYTVLWVKKNELQVINVEDNNKLKENNAEKTEAGEC